MQLLKENSMYFQGEYVDRPTNQIEAEILQTSHMLGKIQLLGILLKRHGTNYLVENITGRTQIFFLSLVRKIRQIIIEVPLHFAQ